MQHIKYEFEAGPDDLVVVTLDHAANVRLLDPTNYSNYRNGRGHRYLGGYYKTTPVRLQPPHSGHWYVAVDIGGYNGRVSASVQVLRA